MEQNTREHGVLHHSVLKGDGTERHLVHPQYQLIKAISTDASGALYRGKSLSDGRVVAIKVFSEESTPALVAHYNNELQLDNLIEVKEVLSSNGGLPLAIMDMPGGACLEKILARNGKLPMAAAVHIALNVSLIIRAIHMLNETHGHVNSQNVFLKRQPTGRIRVQLLHHRLVGRPSRFNIPCFLSPELTSENDVVLPSDDNWAIGVLLYHMLFGTPPFRSSIRDETARRILTENVFLPEEFERHFGKLASFLRRTLSRELSERPSGREMNLELKSLLQDLRGTPDSVAPGRVAAEVDCIEKPAVELPRSVPAESFLDDDLQDTLPEPVLSLDDDEENLSSRVSVQSAARYESDEYPESNSEKLAGWRAAAPIDETPVLGSAPIDETPVLGSAPIEDETKDDQMLVELSGTSLLSIAPPQLPSRQPEKEVVVESSKKNRTQPPLLESVQFVHSESLTTAKEKRSRLVVAAVIAAASIAVSFILVMLVSLRSGQEEKGSSNVEAAQVKPTAAELGIWDPTAQKASNENVTITLKGLPPRARITLNGMGVDPPLIVPKSDTPVAIQAIVGNRIIFSATVLPTESQTYHVVRQKKKYHKK